MNPTALLPIFLVKMIAWYVPGGRVHIANVWQDLYCYAWRAWIEVRYPNWRESMRVRAIIALIVMAVVLVAATYETFGAIVQIGLLGCWLNRYLHDNQLSKEAGKRIRQDM